MQEENIPVVAHSSENRNNMDKKKANEKKRHEGLQKIEEYIIILH
jgi:hypothetical protein